MRIEMKYICTYVKQIQYAQEYKILCRWGEYKSIREKMLEDDDDDDDLKKVILSHGNVSIKDKMCWKIKILDTIINFHLNVKFIDAPVFLKEQTNEWCYFLKNNLKYLKW